MWRRVLIGLAIGAVAALVAAVVTRTPLFTAFENHTYDSRLSYAAQPVGPASNIAIIEVNESSLSTLEPALGRWPWPRIAHATLVDYLAAAGAKLIVFDIFFGEHDTRGDFALGAMRLSGPSSDAALVDSVRKAGNVILAVDAASEGLANAQAAAAPALPKLPGVTYQPGPGFQPRPVLSVPFPELLDAARGVGHTTFVQETDGSIRRALPFIDVRGLAVPGLGMAAALAVLKAGDRDVEVQGTDLRIQGALLPLLAAPVPPVLPKDPWLPSRQTVLAFRQPVTSAAGVTTTYPEYPFVDVLISADRVAANQTPPIPQSAFKDKIVFIGTSAASMGDIFTTPMGKGGVPGVLLHASLTDSVLSRRFMRRASTATDVLVTGVVGLVAGLCATAIPVGWAVGAIVVFGGAVVAVMTSLVGQGVWLGLVMPLSAMALATFGGTAWQYFVEGRSKRQVKQLFGRYVNQHVIDQLMADPTMAQLGGRRREMSVLFSDIRNFTTASEKSTPEQVVAQLNEYFTAMVEVLFRHQGTLDKFVGDMVMGLFGAPLDDPKHADHAVETALEMIRVLDEMNVRWKAEGRPVIDIGIGINSGDMIAGNIGAEQAMSYTVIGDAVNLGSRLESLNKEHGTTILISQATADRLSIPVEKRLVGDIKVKGKTQATTVYEIVVERHRVEPATAGPAPVAH